MWRKRTVALVVVIIAIIGAVFYLESQKTRISPSEVASSAEIVIPSLSAEEKAARFDRAREIVAPAGFINTDDDFNLAKHVGEKVILLDIWTYSCINCQRTLPFITAWDEMYRDDGLLIVGIHTPEFEFEKEYENVQDAVERFGIAYPVVLDNDYGTWHAYQNIYWPRKYLIDIDGFVVYDHIGEGAYQETEQKIRELLKERAERLGTSLSFENQPTTATPETDIDRVKLPPRSPEVYFGAWRNELLGNGEQNVIGGFVFEAPERIRKSTLYLDGAWNIHREYAQNAATDGRVIFRYEGDKVFMVAAAPESATVRLLRDGEPIGESGGIDVDGEGRVRIQEERLYHLVDNAEGHGEHTLEIIVETPGVEIYTFTFG